MQRLRKETREQVVRLSASLPALTERQRAEAQRCHGTAWIGKTTAWCDCCAQEFSHDLWNTRKKHTRCPHCGAKLTVKKSPNKKVQNDVFYFEVVHAVEGWQAIRTYLVRREARRRVMFKDEELHPAEMNVKIRAVYDRFLREGYKPVILGHSIYGGCFYCDLWRWDSEWKIRREGSQHYAGGKVASRPQLLPVLKQRGLKKLIDRPAWRQIDAVLNSPKAEILLKADAMKLFDIFVFYPSSISRRWDSIRVALRHGYKINDPSMWLDLVQMLDQNGKDIRNPHYICPADLWKAHDEQLAIRRRAEEKARREREEQRRRRLAEKLSESGEANREYVARMGKVLGVLVTVGNLQLKPLQGVSEFYEEGEALHHCVFANGYYQKDNCLVIGARVKGERAETIEINTKSWTVMQCRGKYNHPSEHHDRIIKAVEKNIMKFKKALIG